MTKIIRPRIDNLARYGRYRERYLPSYASDIGETKSVFLDRNKNLDNIEKLIFQDRTFPNLQTVGQGCIARWLPDGENVLESSVFHIFMDLLGEQYCQKSGVGKNRFTLIKTYIYLLSTRI